uniref:Uncharacterized protein n=1 Tax=Nymphaea colorata TaxID=210225 RepID=A0A5K0YA24_9MAGN|nr:unnamed protein product [Nymphaea colorata]
MWSYWNPSTAWWHPTVSFAYKKSGNSQALASSCMLVAIARKSSSEFKLGPPLWKNAGSLSANADPLNQGASGVGLKELNNSTIQMASSMGMMNAPINESVFNIEKEINELLIVEVKEQGLSNPISSFSSF